MRYLVQSSTGGIIERTLFQVMDFVPVPLILSAAIEFDQRKEPLFRVHQYVNRAFVQEIGYSLEEIPDIQSWFAFAFPVEEYRNWVKNQWDTIVSHGELAGQSTVEMLALIQCKNGEKRWFEIKAEIGTARLSKWHMVSLRDIHDMRKALEEVSRLATTDPLTELSNRRGAHLVLEEEWSQFEKTGRKFSLILTDVDHFKKINDRYGHHGGDRLLCEIADLLRRNTREIDCVARWGGEEFLIILPGLHREEARSVAERLRRTVEEHKPSSSAVTMSFGCATITTGHSIKTLILATDKAMYEAKNSGRNCVRVTQEDGLSSEN